MVDLDKMYRCIISERCDEHLTGNFFNEFMCTQISTEDYSTTLEDICSKYSRIYANMDD